VTLLHVTESNSDGICFDDHVMYNKCQRLHHGVLL